MKKILIKISGIIFLTLGILLSCNTKKKSAKEDETSEIAQHEKEVATMCTYGDDVSFMKDYIQVIELSEDSNQSRVAVSAALQGRVMSSSADGENGRSYGWINRELFKSQDTLEHINVFGGEERFWLGPEGGQYSIFFKKGTEFTLDDWYTPKLIDLEHFDVESLSATKVVFSKKASLKNYSGFQFNMRIQREVAILSETEIQEALGLSELLDNLNSVAYKTTNTLTNIGDEAWEKETGLLSIWVLGMFNHSPNTTIMIPYVQGNETDLGAVVNDAYFGKVPADRLVVKEKVIYFKGDGKYRSKIGLTPQRAKNIAGSYDDKNGILTIVKYNQPKGVTDYVNSMWEIQEEPYKGDVINAYNDGEPEPGAKPLGPFYELETSSPALALKAGDSGKHIQTTFHLEGSEKVLNPIIEKLFGVTIENIKQAFQ
ncbi:DUF6786 family protein [Seonamhaeicola maritimus]|uniref:DUF6786 family protein n=1 Tax=Seonamhaeicola maritimus TaxID=2591822 RepID=UPI0024946593|nr:DUF6786 family protein [Seonamhaeicola maritimus]